MIIAYKLIDDTRREVSVVNVESLSDFFDDPSVNLEDIVEFDCSNCDLVILPPEIGKCVLMKSLLCHRNKLVNIPSEIGNCAQLQNFHCHNNKLKSLPSEIGNCVQLKNFWCYQNKLKSLPSEIGKCVQLKNFYFSHNKLTTIPPEIGNCVLLKSLDCSHNRLTTIPPEVGKCFRLNSDHIFAQTNPFADNGYIERLWSILSEWYWWKNVNVRTDVLTPLSNQYPDLSMKEIEERYPDVCFELIKIYIETGEIQTTDLPRQKSAGKT